MENTILIVDDDPDDRYLYQLALDRSDVDYTMKIKWFNDGQELLVYLTDLSQYPVGQDTCLPPLILFDIYMPGVCGTEVFGELRRNILWNKIPIMLVTDSDAPDDITRKSAVGIERFVKKPTTLDGYTHLLKTLEDCVLVNS